MAHLTTIGMKAKYFRFGVGLGVAVAVAVGALVCVGVSVGVLVGDGVAVAAAHDQLHRLANQRRIAGVIGARPSSRAIAKRCVRADRALMRAARGAFTPKTKSERSYGHAQPFRTRPPDHDALRATAA